MWVTAYYRASFWCSLPKFHDNQKGGVSENNLINDMLLFLHIRFPSLINLTTYWDDVLICIKDLWFAAIKLWTFDLYWHILIYCHIMCCLCLLAYS